MSIKVSKGLHWPIGIILGIFGVIVLIGFTIRFALQNPVEMANDFISQYKHVDKNINDMIEANIAFNKKYNFTYVATPLSMKSNKITYTITTKDGLAVNDATIEALLTRPDEVQSDIALTLENVNQGTYIFNAVDLTREGRWNLFANVKLGSEQAFKRLKLDTRYPKLVVNFETVIKENTVGASQTVTK